MKTTGPVANEGKTITHGDRQRPTRKIGNHVFEKVKILKYQVRTVKR